MPLPDVYEDEYFSNTIVVSGNVISLSNAFATFNDGVITLSANILEQISIVVDYANNTPTSSNIFFYGAYTNIFTDKIIQYRKTGQDPTVYQAFSFGAVEDNLYALTRYRPDLRNELNVQYLFSAVVNDPETGLPGNTTIIVSQALLNGYEAGIAQMLNKISKETKIPGQV